jgi:hypothetical protein
MSGDLRFAIPNGQDCIATFRRLRPGLRAALALLAVVGTPTTARAFDKESCVDAHASAQGSMNAGRVRESKEHLLVCADSSCPWLVQEDCKTWLSNLDRSPAAEETPTPPLPSPPPLAAQGSHDEPSPGDDLVRVPAVQPRHSLPTAAWVTGALALASFGTAAVLGVTGTFDARSLRDTCAPTCQSSRVSAVRQELLIADLSALTGVAFSAATAWMVWTHREADADDGRKPDPARLSAWITGRSFRFDCAASF